ncbi:MAG: hypothetical protein JNK23_17815 [Opitutaceae bacterium]|nr:hypothetical protein [Opitutaceae bacterium]
MIAWARPAVFAALAGLGAALPAAEVPVLRWLATAVPPTVEAVGVPPETLRALDASSADDAARGRVLAVYAEQSGSEATPTMAGTWRIADGRLRFEPRFPPVRGVRYRAELRLPGAAPVISFFTLPSDTAAPTTEVARVFPSAAVLPENQLKFYVQFSAPMSRGGTYGHVQIRDAAGRAIELPFLELDEELWDPSMTRLTLLIDPGRIKRGVKPLEDIGPVFEENKSYSLVIGAGCRDAEGRPLRGAFEKAFRIGAADRAPPDPVRWTINAPAAGTRAALVVEFGEPMEQALALRLIRVVALAGGPRVIAGEAVLADEERGWSFSPEQAWSRGRHALEIDTTIEDLAGNNVGKPFDVDPFEKVDRPDGVRRVTVEFEIE